MSLTPYWNTFSHFMNSIHTEFAFMPIMKKKIEYLSTDYQCHNLSTLHKWPPSSFCLLGAWLSTPEELHKVFSLFWNGNIWNLPGKGNWKSKRWHDIQNNYLDLPYTQKLPGTNLRSTILLSQLTCCWLHQSRALQGWWLDGRVNFVLWLATR